MEHVDWLRWGEKLRKAMRPGAPRIVRQALCCSCAIWLLCFAPAAGAQQNSPAAQAHPANSSRPVARAESALAAGNATEAIQILSDYLQSHSGDAAARTLLGQAYASAGENERAEEQLQTVLRDDPENYKALATLGEIYARGGQAEKAEPFLARAAEASHGAPRIRLEWAVVLAGLHKYKEAQSALAGVAAPSDREERIRFYRVKASVALGVGDAAGAAAEIEKALDLNPADAGLALATAAVELQAQNWKRAASLAEPLYARSNDPRVGLIVLEAQLGTHADFQHTLEQLRATPLGSNEQLALRQRLAELLAARGEFAAAIEDFRAVADADPSRGDAQFNLALAQFRAGRMDDALASGQKCRELGDNAEIEDLIGDIQEARHDNLNAVKSYQAAVTLAPNEEKYRLALAVELIQHQNFEAARITLQEAEKSQPNSWRIPLALGMVEYLAGAEDAAIPQLLRATQLAPDPEPALRYLGDIEIDRGTAPEPETIVKLCEYADGRPKNGRMQFYCGALTFQRDYVSGDKTHSDEFMRRLHASENLLPKDAAPHCQLGRAYRWLEKWPDALAESETCARLDPDSADAHYRLAQIYRHLGQTERGQKEMKLYEAASARVADKNAQREATVKTFIYTIQNEPEQK